MNKKIHLAMPMEEKYSQIINTMERVAVNDSIQKIVLFPDTHQKKTMEFPSSSAVAVKGHIVPQFTSASVNCGMAFIATDLNYNVMDKKACTSFFNSLKSQIPMTTWSPNISYEEVLHAIGLILKAYKMGKVSNPKNILRNLKDQGFWLNDKIYQKIIKELSIE